MKEVYIAAYEELVQEFIDAGYSEREAEKMAEDGAYDRYTDKIGDMIDRARMMAKDKC